jgi:6,7-dimethyl-8-ribityllumazine synthase
MRIYEGILTAKGLNVAVIVSRFNETITKVLVDGARDCWIRHGGREEAISIFKVPGAFEIPSLARHLAGKSDYDFIVCLGAVIRGATPHFDYIAAEVSKGIAQVALSSSIPVSFGVLTTDTIEQALERAGIKSGNKGWDAMLSGIEMANLLKSI